jgi:glutathione S-transferase
MVKYKLYYFDARGRAELSRMLFALANVDYEDIRVDADEWVNLKQEMPFGQLPVILFLSSFLAYFKLVVKNKVLETEGGERIAQSMAIARFLARQFSKKNEIKYEK